MGICELCVRHRNAIGVFASVITMNSLSNVYLAFDIIVNRTREWHDSEVVVLRAGDLDLLISEIQILDSQVRCVG